MIQRKELYECDIVSPGAGISYVSASTKKIIHCFLPTTSHDPQPVPHQPFRGYLPGETLEKCGVAIGL